MESSDKQFANFIQKKYLFSLPIKILKISTIWQLCTVFYTSKIDRQTIFYFDLDYNCKTERKHKEYNLKGKLKGYFNGIIFQQITVSTLDFIFVNWLVMLSISSDWLTSRMSKYLNGTSILLTDILLDLYAFLYNDEKVRQDAETCLH